MEEEIKHLEGLTIQPLPKLAGCYVIGGDGCQTFRFYITNKPNFINRFFCKWCLGWQWEDKEN